MYKYAVVNDIGQCYIVYKTTERICNQHHVPIPDTAMNYLDKYYHPIPEYIDGEFDFNGDWYLDFEREIKVEEVPQ